jgi:hypothetical protein
MVGPSGPKTGKDDDNDDVGMEPVTKKDVYEY